MVKWAVELSQYGIEYRPRPAIKAQILADFLVEMTVTQKEISTPTWMVYVDGSSTSSGSGAGIIVESPQGDKFQYAIKFLFPATNNEAEYEAFIMGIKLALSVGAKILTIHNDSQLIVSQVNGNYEAKEDKMLEYLTQVNELFSRLDSYDVKPIPRVENESADRLAKLASSLANIDNRKITFLTYDKEKVDGSDVTIFCADSEEPSWKYEIIDYLMWGNLPANQVEARKLRVRAARFTIIDGEQYKRGFSLPYLKCLTPAKGKYVLREIHEGICGNNLGDRALAGKALCQGYFWPTMKQDAIELAKHCHACQEHANFHHQPAKILQPLESPLLFAQWGMDLVVSDNGTQFSGAKIKDWCKGLFIKQFFTSVGNPQANGQTEVTNRTILQHLKTRLGNAKENWVDELPSVLWAYRTTPRSSTGESPFNLAYGAKAVASAEIGEQSWRVKQYTSSGNDQALRMSLDLVDELRDEASTRAKRYRACMTKAYNDRVKPRSFQVGDLVLRKSDILKSVGKLDPKWEDPYKVIEIVNMETYRLQHSDGRILPRPGTWPT
ncbi:uncharacterized protein [Henckelia pumila]|uniref:uncharacterized protein n=1 Tax=Henckelia pumila TaxID=405737 RepID=UPI003C6DF39D